MTRLPFDAFNRMASSGLYSSEKYQRLTAAVLGNSRTTRRFGSQPPSSVSDLPPRTMNRPPYWATVAGTPLQYSSNATGSVTSMSTTTYAAIQPPRDLPMVADRRGAP